MADKEFAQGIYARTPKQDFILADFGFKISEFGPWFMDKAKAAKSSGDEYINIQILQSRGGKPYAEVNNWKPSGQPQQQSSSGDDFEDDLPF